MTDNRIKDLHCILLIDDDAPTNYIHRKVIEKAKLDTHVQTTTSGQEALDYLTCQGQFSNEEKFPQPGIVFLDINMPGMNGWEFLEDYKQLSDAQKAKVVVVMLTTSINPADRERAEKDGDVTEFMSKPLTVDALKKLVDKYFKEVPEQ